MGVITPLVSEALTVMVRVVDPEVISTFEGETLNADKTGFSKSFCEYPFSIPINMDITNSKKDLKIDDLDIGNSKI